MISKSKAEGDLMNKYGKLLRYIPYFEDENIDVCKWITPEKREDGVFTMPYPQYDDQLLKFIQDIYETDLLIGNYLDFLRENVKDEDYVSAIPNADIELLKAILTLTVRKERFCDGAWNGAFKEKIFLSILYRLKELEEL
jgi:hypothetical protein